ncbi:MAG: hypothetical protein VX730_07535 [Pseudomonadota bacterium]|nr:hypothetical protein [Pseudomonadota bacterium]
MSLFVYSSFKWMNDPQVDFDAIKTADAAEFTGALLGAFVAQHHPYKTAIELPYQFPFAEALAKGVVGWLSKYGDSNEQYGVGMWEKDVPTFQAAARDKNFLALPKS